MSNRVPLSWRTLQWLCISLTTSAERHLLNDCYGKMSSIQILIVDWVNGVSYWCPDMLLFFLFFFIKCWFLPFISFMLGAVLFALKLYYSLHSFCIFWTTSLFCLSALSHIASLFCFSPWCFCSVKTPRKAVLFHEYQASTGRSNKFVSLLAASLCLLWMLCCGHVCLCACLFNYRPPMWRKYA